MWMDWKSSIQSLYTQEMWIVCLKRVQQDNIRHLLCSEISLTKLWHFLRFFKSRERSTIWETSVQWMISGGTGLACKQLKQTRHYQSSRNLPQLLCQFLRSLGWAPFLRPLPKHTDKKRELIPADGQTHQPACCVTCQARSEGPGFAGGGPSPQWSWEQCTTKQEGREVQLPVG